MSQQPDPNDKARRALAKAHALLGSGKLAEAHTKALAAQKLVAQSTLGPAFVGSSAGLRELIERTIARQAGPKEFGK